MPQTDAETILAHLQEVERQRHYRRTQAGLASRVEQIKQYQQQRFRLCYEDLLSSERYGGAATFFLEHLYGPGDFSKRDAQFARVIPAVAKLFPKEVLATIAKLASLHALSETIDTRMALLVGTDNTDAPRAYTQAWQDCGQAEERAEQIRLTLAIGHDLDRLTRKPLLRQALRMMRGPASAAGLHELQQFLETGFDTFRAMKGAGEFLSTVLLRETEFAAHLFAVDFTQQVEGTRTQSWTTRLPKHWHTRD